VFALGGWAGGGGGPGAQAGRARRSDDGSTTARRSGRGGLDEEDIVQGRRRDLGRAGVEAFQRSRGQGDDPPAFGFGAGQAPAANVRTIFRFSPDVRKLLSSGRPGNGHELANAPPLAHLK